MEQCVQMPEWLTFKKRVSYALWAEFNLMFFIVWVRGQLDISSLFSIIAFSSLVAVKLRQFADHTKVEKEESIEYLDSQQFQQCSQQVVDSINQGIKWVAGIHNVESYLKFFASLVVVTFILSFFSLNSLIYSVGNMVFLDQFMKNVSNIDPYLIAKHQLQKALETTGQIYIPKYKESKKNI